MSTKSVGDPPSLPPPPPPPQAISPKDRKMLALIRNSAPVLLQNIQSGLSRLPVELVWAAHSQWPLQPEESRAQQPNNRPIRISILDSSFNPPTLAHLALANSARPKYHSEPPGSEYDAKLLLLSVKNADKTLKPGDASYHQRLEMMALLAKEVRTHYHRQGGDNHNLAIAIVDEPTFVGKSRVLQEYLRNRLATLLPETQSHPCNANVNVGADASTKTIPINQRPQLTFIVGMDTLERLFSPRYYPPSPPSDPTTTTAAAGGVTAEQTMITVLSRMLSPYPEGDDTLIVCAKRGNLPSDKTQDSKGESGYASTLKLGIKCGWMKDPDTSAHSTSGSGSVVPPDPRHPDSDVASPTEDDGNIPNNERIVIINIGDRESKFSSTAVRNARARMGLVGSEVGGGPWKQWVTKSVAQYIEEEKLYVSSV
ncbi:hypothetical protein EST38_g347 [Candolleomyces aberdarensis]|uniref:Nicotinamide-nucleotide adenylyltransferase n=1 Tax=Candolleomyces aberdarensis TaxID=2316362 RepID=A0A4Q2DXR5_9AGAR|nr:hypothetical protein EST38_g347 [Candolleomyces aberdarensis]